MVGRGLYNPNPGDIQELKTVKENTLENTIEWTLHSIELESKHHMKISRPILL